jgi:hypothetical protein
MLKEKIVEVWKGRKGREVYGQSAVVVGGSTPADRDGWMWDLTVPGNNDHDFYVQTAGTAVLVHNCSPGEITGYTRRVIQAAL